MIEVSVILIWLGCLSAYLSSTKQNLISAPFHKGLGWTGFIALLMAALIFTSIFYSVVVSSLFTLAVLMFSWISIVLIQGHKTLKVLPSVALVFLVLSTTIRLV